MANLGLKYITGEISQKNFWHSWCILPTHYKALLYIP